MEIEDRIRVRAFEIWSAQGHKATPLDNWLAAEAEILSREPIWDVVLVDAGASPIAVITELRALTGYNLRDLETLVAEVPGALRRAISRIDAESLRERAEAAGARVEIRPARGGSS